MEFYKEKGTLDDKSHKKMVILSTPEHITTNFLSGLKMFNTELKEVLPLHVFNYLQVTEERSKNKMLDRQLKPKGCTVKCYPNIVFATKSTCFSLLIKVG